MDHSDALTPYVEQSLNRKVSQLILDLCSVINMPYVIVQMFPGCNRQVIRIKSNVLLGRNDDKIQQTETSLRINYWIFLKKT